MKHTYLKELGISGLTLCLPSDGLFITKDLKQNKKLIAEKVKSFFFFLRKSQCFLLYWRFSLNYGFHNFSLNYGLIQSKLWFST